jgi:hypothetical protein
LCIGVVDSGTEIAKLEVFHKFVVGGESAGWAAELGSVVPVEEFANCAPFFGAGDDCVSDFEQNRWLGMPEAGSGETSSGFKMQIKAGRVNIFFFFFFLPLHLTTSSLCIDFIVINIISRSEEVIQALCLSSSMG